jgi:putative spermidine/putrescine transport system substrate-binding protein
VPKEGAIAFRTTMHITKNSPNQDLAFKLIEAALSPEVQTALMASPYLVTPTNTKVKIQGELTKLIADTDSMPKRFVFQDWAKINEQRAGWLERFNREMKG